ncbi:MAG: hypothetical protein IH961_04760, partial [Chloroflexi bacterium]|nr:hypothetical protein [Chloroflexota bacterium]
LDAVLENWLLTDRLVNSLIRLKRFDQAFDIATQHRKANDNEPWYPTIVKAAEGDVAATARWLEKCDDYGYISEDYYDDEVLAAALRSPGFESLRKKYPEPRSDDMPPPTNPTP